MVFKVLNSLLFFFFTETILFGTNHHITDTTIVFNEVIVQSNRLNEYGIGLTVQKLDSFALLRQRNQSLTELLALETSISVKSYGPAGLAGISIRGGDTRHTAVLWNGLNLQSPMNASFNFSTLPVSFIDAISIQHGGSGTLFGSGATSGAIHIDNSLRLDQPLTIEAGFSGGSYKTINQIASINYSSHLYATSARYSHRAGDNDFTFINYEKHGHPLDTLKHAGYNGNSFMQQNLFRINPGSDISTDFWYQKYTKYIPSLMTDMLPGRHMQTDENIRLSVNSSHVISNLLLYTRLGLLNDKILYDESNSHSLSVISEVEGKYLIGKHHKLDLAVNYTYETAYAEGYPDNPYRQRAAIFGSYGLSVWKNKLLTIVNYRLENVNGTFIPLVYSLNAKIECLPGLFLKSNFSKNYSLPTFNDLYWKSQGAYGNPDLLPESGLSMEGSLEYNHAANHLQIYNEVSVYKSEINNWISWPSDSNGNYIPVNFKKGESKGLEINTSLEFSFSRFRIQLSGMYAYTIARLLDTGEGKEIYKGKQMIYVPRNKVSGNVLIGWKTLNLTYIHTYTGQRYASANEILDPFNLDEISISKDWKLKKYTINLFFKTENIMNTSYQLTKSYAMPGRSYLCGLNFKFQTK
jgi:vitamin B12 transporter